MAKRQSGSVDATKNSTMLDFDDLNKELNNISEYGSLLSDNPSGKIEDWISTGSYTLNALISGSIFKGIPSGRITVFSGVSASGKTFMALNSAAQAQKKGYNVIWLDSENALDIDNISNFGIDPKRFRHELVNTVSEVSTYVKKLTSFLMEKKKQKLTPPKIFIVLDSLGNLSTDKEIKDVESGSDKADMTRAKDIKKMFRVLTTEIAKLQIPMVMVNHVYENITAFFGGTKQGGGSGVIYGSSITVKMSPLKLTDEQNGPKVGIIVKCEMDKARFTVPNVIKKIQIHFFKGMNPYVGLESFITEEAVNDIGFGPGKYVKTRDSYEYDGSELPINFYLVNEKRQIKRNEMFKPKYFTQEVLEKIDKLAIDQLQYSKALSDFSDVVDDIINDEDGDDD